MIQFSKYHGAGNDFILIDNRSKVFDQDNFDLIARLCDRHFGIGADGLMLLEDSEEYDFEMVYFNADGRTSSMCGNGGRCIVSFAQSLGVVDTTASFMAIDGAHRAIIKSPELVSLEMNNVNYVEALTDGALLIDTGSPHYIKKIEGLNDVDIVTEARKIRYSDQFAKDGVNVNFIEIVDGVINIRTYERGVEDETLACGTGVTAAAIATRHLGIIDQDQINVNAVGGRLSVSMQKTASGYEDIWKTGPVSRVFEGQVQ